MTLRHATHTLTAVAAIFALAMLVGCKGGDSCKKDFAEPTAGTGGTLPPTGGGTGGTDPSGGGSTGGDPAPDGDIGSLLEKINDARQTAGLSQLQWDSKIAAVAQNYAQYCATIRQYSPTLSGTPSSRLKQGGVSFSNCDETGKCDEWPFVPSINSDLDRNKLLNPAFNRIGIGYYNAHYS